MLTPTNQPKVYIHWGLWACQPLAAWREGCENISEYATMHNFGFGLAMAETMNLSFFKSPLKIV